MVAGFFPLGFRVSGSIKKSGRERFSIAVREVWEISISCSRDESTLWYCRVDGYRLLWVTISYSVWECMNVSMLRFWLYVTLSDVPVVPASTHKWGIALKCYLSKEKWSGSGLRALVELLVTISFSRSIRELWDLWMVERDPLPSHSSHWTNLQGCSNSYSTIWSWVLDTLIVRWH